ncbi:cytochrome c oxidase assembly protein [Lysobacter ciconiae]|uniref:Cytochrome c oxidase assembly protein CtaG n=1 Tax=Novilysobacter ciconiae TaxID=2781022 RepID=A0A7S6UFF6_9GAMM|nr:MULTISPECIES: cytochrome c oxidase assembly protein [Lysobacter]QOW19297.1 cytochrome c oxidase assembly protein [Lysobacter ciconiae]QOY62509.1 cytochrome c oxidase assembly protein [Lysobacter sp. H21R4]
MSGQDPSPAPRRATTGLAKMLVAAAIAFAFSFSLVPLYRIACQKVFGIRIDNTASDARRPGVVDEDRMITVQFDGGVNSKLPWAFKPGEASMQVRPGQQYETTYFAHNKSDRTIVGSAVPSVAPARASGYFSKTECFCFTAQTMAAGESRDMPVRFIVDPGLPKDIKTLTLSYTFFKNDSLTAQQASADHPAPVPVSAP